MVLIIGIALLIAFLVFMVEIDNKIKNDKYKNACRIINNEFYETKTSKHICSINNMNTNTDGDTNYYISRIYKTDKGKYFEAYIENFNVELRGLSKECAKEKIANENLIEVYKNEFGLSKA